MSSPSTPWTSSSVKVLSCHTCRKRKTKCDRKAPTCTPCSKAARACEYPRHQLKPGPKPGHRTPVGRSQRHSFAAPSPQSVAPLHSTFHDNGLGATSLPSNASDAMSFSELTYPSEGVTSQQEATAQGHQCPTKVNRILGIALEHLEVTRELGNALLSSYFSNMTAFSLFSREILDNRLARTKSILDAEALLASIFSFAARFVATPSAETSDHTGSGTPAASHFATIASQRLRRAYTESEDLTPSLTLIQAYILLSYFELTESVRPRSWRILGECVRIAYEIRLHAIDEDFDPDSDISAIGIDLEQWTMREEYRRAWWAIWEMDVFASTLRRLPTAIDWTQNFTLLPVPDSDWFSRSYQKSCFLASDPALRWKDLTKSGNRSAKAWFILINSLMRNTQVLVFSARALALEPSYAEQLSVDLTLVSNALSCTSVSLPDELVYSGEILNFENDTTDGAQLQADADKYSIHLMTQLSHVMINNYSVRARAPWANNTSKSPSHSHGLHSRASTVEWTKYLNAAEEIVKIVRNSNPRHYRHVNPFLVNTLWFAAAAQCSCRVFGPTSLTRQHRLAGSNLDLLQLTIDRFISFWGSTEKLKAKLARLERGLVTLMQPRDKEYGDSSRSTQSDMILQDANAASMLEPTGLDLLTANWDPVLGSEEDVYDENILHSFAGNFPFGLDDLIAFANA